MLDSIQILIFSSVLTQNMRLWQTVYDYYCFLQLFYLSVTLFLLNNSASLSEESSINGHCSSLELIRDCLVDDLDAPLIWLLIGLI